jgi:hypothetical protein
VTGPSALKVPLQSGPLDPDVQLAVSVAQLHRCHRLRRDDPGPPRRQRDLLIQGLDTVDALKREVDVVKRLRLQKLHVQPGARAAHVDEADGPELDRRGATEYLCPRSTPCRREVARRQQAGGASSISARAAASPLVRSLFSDYALP